MDYIELTISTTTAGSEAVSELLMNLGAAGTQIIDRADLPDPDKPGKNWELMDKALISETPEDVRVKAWFPLDEQARQTLGLVQEKLTVIKQEDAQGAFGALTLSSDDVHEQDWSECWKQYYKPFRAGKLLVIKPTWEDWDAQPDDLIIELDPGMAFGTGTHETTAMCITLIEKYYAGGRLLDVGTGSGILAIAAARLGAKNVVAVDIDPDAVRVAEENVAHNGLSDCITVREGDLLQGLNETFDFAVANILAPVICMLSVPLKNHLRKNGLFICSGIINEAEQDVLNALNGADYTVLEVIHKNDWVAVAARA